MKIFRQITKPSFYNDKYIHPVVLFFLINMILFSMRSFHVNAQEPDDILLQNPRIVSDSSMESGQKMEWDCVYFGKYPQAEIIPSGTYVAVDETYLLDGDVIIDDALYEKLKYAEGWDTYGDIEIEGEKYRRIEQSDVTHSEAGYQSFYQWTGRYHFFQYQPIKWRVINVSGNRALLLSDKILDNQIYDTYIFSLNTELGDIWKKSLVRSFLNSYGAEENRDGRNFLGEKSFLHSACGDKEKNAILTTSFEGVKENGDQQIQDKIFFLSENQIFRRM